MPPSTKHLYQNRIFGDDGTPPRVVPSKKPSALYDPTRPSWYTSDDEEESTKATKPTHPDAAPAPSAQHPQNDNSIYPFKHDLLASARLNLQHHLFVSSTGFLLHPLIPVRDNILVADVGCGTGIWSLEVSKTLPTGSRIEAFDLDISQTPPKAFHPDKISFSHLDIFAPIPHRLIGRYDVVNIRLFMCVVSSGDPLPLLRQLTRMLKPGGYLQWQEYDSTTDKLVLADPSVPAPKLKALRDHIRGPQLGTWVKDLHLGFGEAGGELVRHERHWTPKESVIVKQDVSFLAVREWAEKLRETRKGSGEAGTLERLVREAEEECWAMGRGAFYDSEIVTWVVQKV